MSGTAVQQLEHCVRILQSTTKYSFKIKACDAALMTGAVRPHARTPPEIKHPTALTCAGSHLSVDARVSVWLSFLLQLRSSDAVAHHLSPGAGHHGKWSYDAIDASQPEVKENPNQTFIKVVQRGFKVENS